MIFKTGFRFRFIFLPVLIVAAVAAGGCSPREQARGKRWKTQADAYLEGKEAPSESAWPIRVSEDDEDSVVQQPVTFDDLLEGLPSPQSWPRLQSGMVLRFLTAQGKGEWRTEIQNRILHLFFIYLNDSNRYSTRRWDRALERLNKRLDAIAAVLPKDSPDQEMIQRVRMQIASADHGVKTRFGKPDGRDEVKEFEDQLKSLEPLDPKEVAKRVGGETELAKMESFLAEVNTAYEKLAKKIGEAVGKKIGKSSDEDLKKEFEPQVKALQARYESQVQKYQKVMEDPMVERYFYEKAVPGEEDHVQSLMVPDLVTIVGPAKAEEFLKQALLFQVVLNIPVGNDTQALASALALKNVNQLKVPQFQLVNSIQGVPLFEALQKRFPAKSNEQFYSGKSQAEVYYLFGLIAQNRADDALAWMGKIYPSMNKEEGNSDRWYVPSSLFEQMKKAGYGEQVWSFLAKLLDRYPNLPLWDKFIDLSSDLDKNPAMLELVERTVKREGLKTEIRGKMQETTWKMKKILADAYLASDRVEDGVAALRSLLSQPGGDESDTWRYRFDIGIQLATLGQLLQRSDWLEEGLAVAEGQLSTLQAKDLRYYRISELVAMYEKLGRTDDAERVIKAGLQILATQREELAKKKAENPKSDSDYSGRNENSREEDAEFLEALLALSVNQNRDQDAINLLTQSPDWGKPDLADFLDSSTGYPSYPTGYWAAWALGRLGRSDESLAVAKGQIRVEPGSDGAYAILNQLKGIEALPFLEKIYKMDRFEERPLIWKAKILCDAGQLDEAEAAAKEAITVDPSDGEQGKGDRMRVYAVMAEIEKKRGNEEKAKFFENVVKAIRLSEDADDYHEAGLNTRAIAMYREALGFFSDAYCIQSRLARQLAEQHQEEEAMQHYQRAFELMPDSFGRVESHCFGCEKAFAGEKAQGVAEKVFLKMLKEQPGKPQLHYLMGYLREEQDHYDEALAYYKQAVALDPLYLNAWKRIEGLKSSVRIDPRTLDEVNLTLLDLDPARRHSSPDLDSVNDLPKLWGHLQLSDRVLNMVPRPDAVFELTASAEALEDQKRAKEKLSSENGGKSVAVDYQSRGEKSFAQILLDHPAVRAIHEALESIRKTKTQEAGAIDPEAEDQP